MESHDPHSGPVCQVFHRAVEVIGKRWNGVVIYTLTKGPKRFCEFHEAIPDISDRLLTERLKELEEEGIVVREVNPGRPVQVVYRLTPKGESLRPVLDAIGGWASQWHGQETSAP
jgi:DNA-binding HxlR family transcriptional regulator